MKNWPLKVFSLAVALLLSYFVNSESNSSVISFLVPVEVKNIPTNKVIVWPTSRQVQVSLRGPSFLVSRFAASPSTFKLQVPADVGERFLVSLNKDDLALPRDVQLVAIEPSDIELRFDELVSKTISVVVPKIGYVADGYRLESIEVDPAVVTVSGPSTEIRKLESIESAALDLQNAADSFQRVMSIRMPPGGLEIEPAEVGIKVKISPVQVTRRFEKLPVEVRAVAGENWRLTPSTVDIECTATKAIIGNIAPDQLIPFVRPSAEGGLSQALKIAVDLPQGVALTVVHPSVAQAKRVKDPGPIKPTVKK